MLLWFSSNSLSLNFAQQNLFSILSSHLFSCLPNIYQHVNVSLLPSSRHRCVIIQQLHSKEEGVRRKVFLPTTQRLTSTQRNNAAVWLPAKMANSHLVICGDTYNVRGRGFKKTPLFFRLCILAMT